MGGAQTGSIYFTYLFLHQLAPRGSVMDFPNHSPVNFVFPNDHEIAWSLLIVIYPYITGLIAGAFVVSALYKVFKIKEFKCIEDFSLVAAFCFGLFAALPLLAHLGQPLRAFNIFFTPNATSAMSIFGYVYGSYMILLIVELWLVYRPFFIQKANETRGIEHRIWWLLTLGVTVYNPDSEKLDNKLEVFLACIGIPWACALHGYVGFIFGSVKARAWWATPLQPLIFLLSAIVSGMAMLLIMYTFIKWWQGVRYDFAMIKKYVTVLWVVFILDFVLEILEVIFAAYEMGHHWSLIGPLLKGPLFETYIIGQLLVLSLSPFILLGYAVLVDIKEKSLLYLANLGSGLLVLQVLLMRYNVVIGGQMVAKSERGFVKFHWDLYSSEGLLVCVAIFVLPFITYYLISQFIPIFDAEEEVEATKPFERRVRRVRRSLREER
jgi:Ni/Fe-hydrogenase subunit HybB-like protein